MIRLNKNHDEPLWAAPRWPYQAVFVSEAAHAALVHVQNDLASEGIRLILTRGFENEGVARRIFHRVARAVGALLFLLCYPWRMQEIDAIFSCNGHTVNGNHVDIAVWMNGERLRFLPLGVFTPRFVCRARRWRYGPVLGVVTTALGRHGFLVHPNATEALQIHCDYIGS